MMRLRAILLVIGGLILVFWAASRATAEVLPSFQPTPTPEQLVLERFAPVTGHLNRQASSGEIESAPVTATLTPAPTLQPSPTPFLPATPAPRPSSFPRYSQQEMEAKSGPFLGEIARELPTPTPPPHPVEPAVPTRILIPGLNLDAPVALAAAQKVQIGESVYYQWDSPNLYAAGWHTRSAPLGQPGNTVLNGHNNIYGAVFGTLEHISEGDPIVLFAGEREFHYLVVNRMILPESGAPISQRLENARWLSSSPDERLTLVTCWPNDSNTHRLIVVAVPDPAYAGR